MKNLILTVLKVLLLAIIYTVLATLASNLTNSADLLRRMTPEQINQGAIALPLVSLIMTIMLVYLALRSRWHGWKLAAALAVIPYMLYYFLGQVEVIVIPAVASQMPEGMVLGTLVSGLAVMVPFSLLAVWILGKTRADRDAPPADRLQMPLEEWAWKVVAGALLYVLVYFAFGYYVAWRTPGLPEFYGGTDPGSFLGQLANVMRGQPWNFPLQFARGLIWVGLGCILLRMHKGPVWEVVLATGLAFTVLMNASLLFPNVFWPAFVARAHATELLSSNFVYGVLLALLMLWEPVRRARPITAGHYAG